MCFFLFYPSTISMITSSFNSEAISSQVHKIKSTFSTVLFEAFQLTTKIYIAGWFAFLILLCYNFVRVLVLLIFFPSFLPL